MFLVIDRKYRIFQTKELTKPLKRQARNGEISIVDVDSMKGINRKLSEYDNVDGFWSEIPELDPKYGLLA